MHYRRPIKCQKINFRPCIHCTLATLAVFSATITDNSTRSYENQSVHRAVSKLVKTAINTAITVKLLKSKVTLLNTCEI